MSEVPTLPLTKALAIATSDSGGGAGIQADLKTFAAFGVYGLCVLSGVSAQNTVAVTGLELLSPSLVTAQLQAVFADIGVDAVKIGLLGDRPNAEAVRAFLSRLDPRPPVILDPVMVSASGHAFLSRDAIAALRDLAPLASAITPNLAEARVLSGLEIDPDSETDLLRAAERLMDLGSERVIIKGGHGRGPLARDLFFGGAGPVWLTAERVDTRNNHGTGCTFSSAIAAAMARGEDLEEAAHLAKQYVTGGLRRSIDLGSGPGPLNHFHHFYNLEGAKTRGRA
jgi:hydroxymethylpyrimidine/phosphomethylpyrimidine kinase